jgi:hypothetical protein
MLLQNTEQFIVQHALEDKIILILVAGKSMNMLSDFARTEILAELHEKEKMRTIQN